MDAREAARLAVLESFQIVDTPREERFDRLTRLASGVFKAPISLVTLVSGERQWFKSSVGVGDLEHTARSVSFCTYAIQDPSVMVVEDAREDARFAGNPLVTGPPFIRFYAGAPILTRDGFALGTLCVIDTAPRQFDETARSMLADMAAIVMDELELRKRIVSTHRSEAVLSRARAELSGLDGRAMKFILELDVDGTVRQTNAQALAKVGAEIADVRGKLLWQGPWWQDDRARDMLRDATRRAGSGLSSVVDVSFGIRSGEWAPMQFVISPLTDERGRIDRLVACGLDVSERLAVAEEHIRLARIVDEAPFLIRSETPDGEVLYVNRAGRALLGYAPETELAGSLVAHHHPEWALRLMRNEAYPSATDEGTWSGQAALIGDDGREVPVSQVVIAHKGEDGKVEHYSTVAIDISAEQDARQSLIDSEARFRGTFDNAAVGIAHVSASGRWQRVNERLLEIVGRPRADLMLTTVQDITAPGDVAAERQLFDELMRGARDSYKLEKRVVRRDGSLTWVHATVSVQQARGGGEPYAIVVLEDVGEQKAFEHRQRLLLAELNHRVKNTLAVIQSIAQQSLRQTKNPQEFVPRFLGRLQALSGAHDLLTRQTWEGADLAELLRIQVTLNGAVEQERILLDGPSVTVPPQFALNLAIVLHELAANALRHGALSVAGGQVSVTWTTDQEGAARWLDLDWVERGGPAVQDAPRRRGFGTLMLERSLKQGLGGTFELDWRAEGLSVHMRVPVPNPAPLVLFET